jgi:cysteine synthase A
MSRSWEEQAIQRIEADFTRSADTHLIHLELPAFPEIDLYLKDESVHPTGSLKHRLARSLFLYGLCNGWIREGRPVIEASSGSTAVSEAYFARLLGLPFIAVMPSATSEAKKRWIEFYDGRCHLVDDPSSIDAESRRLARELGGHFMDQFTFAERATDWRGNNNIAESIFAQMGEERHPVPSWIVTGAGTGGTSATLGRFARYQRHATRICVVDPEPSVFFDCYRTGDRTLRCEGNPGVEGIGRPCLPESFLPTLVDRMYRVPNAASYAGMRFLEGVLGRKVGGSTGTNLWGAAHVISGMAARGERGSVVILLCDVGERYTETYYDDAWLEREGHDITPYLAALRAFYEVGSWEPARADEVALQPAAGSVK